MDAYLEVAETVLRSLRRPLTPRAILAAAYTADIVPTKLFGKTQHKTLGARLSEDIVRLNERSAFFRPAPGKYFLREFLTDETLPSQYRKPFPTRRRFRELVSGASLCLERGKIEEVFGRNSVADPVAIFSLLRSSNFSYKDPRQASADTVFIRSFVCVVKDSEILTYRLGRYRENRDSFTNKRCIGFWSLVRDVDHNLFNQSSFGIVDSGLSAVKTDLEIPEIKDPTVSALETKLSHFVLTSSNGATDLLAVMSLECPGWFEPTKRRLALNDLTWANRRLPVNNIDDFDPWSKQILATEPCGSLF